MAETLCSVGLDVGTTTTQLIVSQLRVENRASAFVVPKLEITDRKIRYQSPVYFTPLLHGDLVDGEGIRKIVEKEYALAGITPLDVDTGAVIITGETSRKENANTVLQALSEHAGDFVVATAGPDLESALAARGSGAVAYSEKTGKRVLHMDIGGGTSNLALIEDGKILQTGCMNVGGRLVKIGEDGRLTYISPVARQLVNMEAGDIADKKKLEELADLLAQGLEMAAGLREISPLWEKLVTRESIHTQPAAPGAVISFSGGVADCIGKDYPDFAFEDLGPVLGRAIRKSRLCKGAYMLAENTIRATVIGAGCHSATLSGSTVFYRNVTLPVKNLPVAALDETQQTDAEAISRALQSRDAEQVVLAIPGMASPGYEDVRRIAKAIAETAAGRTVFVCLQADMAKALGQCLALLLPRDASCLCIDRVELGEGDYLDIGQPVGPALPVVVKTLVLSHKEDNRSLPCVRGGGTT